MKIVIAAVMHSPNLGDGLIAECMSDQIRKSYPDADIQWLDLAGRDTWTAPAISARTKVLDALAQMPKPVSERISGALVRSQVRLRLAPRIPDALDDADFVIIGGGQLFGSANLNFPIKLSYLVKEIERRGLPFAIHSVGVAGKWSKRAYPYFGKVLTSQNLKWVSVRDHYSSIAIRKHFVLLGKKPSFETYQLPDPALAAAKWLGRKVESPKQVQSVGLGIIHPAALATHASATTAPSLLEITMQYRGLIDALVEAGIHVQLFSNGAGEDEEMIDHLCATMPAHRNVTRVPRASTPRALLKYLACVDAVASHRLHACIAAHAVGRRVVGFQWDRKVNSYFSLVEQSDNLFANLRPKRAIVRALMQPFQPDEYARITELEPFVGAGLNALIRALTNSNRAPERATTQAPQTSATHAAE